MSPEPRLLPVRIYGDNVLRLKAEEVSRINEELREFAADLVHTMYKRDGVGLAAPQVGSSIRVIAVDPHWSRDGMAREPVVMINPVIEANSGETETEEGCISLPGIFAYVVRPSVITVSYTDLQGERQRMELSGYPAVVIQHEIDHLDGILFIDRLGTIARLKQKLKLKELARTTVDGENIRTDL
ncbi:MAG: peptide deformylase [Candidatus Syntrophosphaera sp.]|nr:peptide deformylase [Candidatus Syntrophosphaera sp.]